jgi:hypothetical protein
MTPVRQFYVDNLQSHLDATLAAANSTTGAVYLDACIRPAFLREIRESNQVLIRH